MAVQRQKIGPLSAVVVEGASSKHTIVLCHGYGADANDLAPLCAYLDKNQLYRWVFPEAPLEVPIGMHMSGRAWFPIDMQELEKVIQGRDATAWARMRPAALDRASEKLHAFLEALGVDETKLVLGGFSQGSMVSIDTALKYKIRCAGLGVLSGTLFSEDHWQGWAEHCKGQYFFQSHGRHDPVLPFALAQKLNARLTAWGMVGTTHFFDGGHEIPYHLFEHWVNFLAERLPA